MNDNDHPYHPWMMAAMMVTIIHLSPDPTQPVIQMICTQLGGPFLGAFPLCLKLGEPHYVRLG